MVVAFAVIATIARPTDHDEREQLPAQELRVDPGRELLQDKAFPAAGHVTAAAAIIVFSRADGGKLIAADSAKIASIASSLIYRHIHNIAGVTAGPAYAQPAGADRAGRHANSVVATVPHGGR